MTEHVRIWMSPKEAATPEGKKIIQEMLENCLCDSCEAARRPAENSDSDRLTFLGDHRHELEKTSDGRFILDVFLDDPQNSYRFVETDVRAVVDHGIKFCKKRGL